VFTKPAEDFLDLFTVSRFIGRINENVVEINDITNVQHVSKDVVHEALESTGGVGKAEGHNQPLEGPILCTEGGFPFVTFADANEVVGVPQINFGVDPRLSWRI